MDDFTKIYVEIINERYPALYTDIRIRSGIYSFIYNDVWLGHILTEDGIEKRHYIYYRDYKQYKFAQMEMNLDNNEYPQ